MGLECYNELIELKPAVSLIRGWNSRLDAELDQVFIAKDEIILLVYLRRALEIIISHLVTEKLKRKRGTEPLSGLVDKLYHNEHMPSNIYTSFRSVTQLCNFGAHPGDFNTRQVRSVLLEFQTILEWLRPGLQIEQEPEEQLVAGAPVIADEGGFKGNPFLNRSAVRNPDFFIGRQELLSKIFSRLAHDKPQSVSLVGDSRTGKSCVLAYINNRLVQREYLPHAEKYCVVYIDLQGHSHKGPGGVCEAFFSNLPPEFKNVFPWITGMNGYNDMETFMHLAGERNFRVILLLDEFEVITRNSSFDLEFYSFLRSLANNYNIAYVTASFRSLPDLCRVKQIGLAPFFGIFHTFVLGPFNRDESIRLITTYLDKTGSPFSFSSYYDKIFSETGDLPFFIQIFCSILYDFYCHGEGDGCIAKVTEAFHTEVCDHFTYIWTNLEDTEREVILMVARNQKLKNRKWDAFINKLLTKGYLVRRNESLDVFSGSFRSQVLDEHFIPVRNSRLISFFRKLNGK